MKKKIYKISGMHCKSCEILIEDNLKQIKGVTGAQLDYHSGVAEVSYEGELSDKDVERMVQQAGYKMGEGGKLPLISRDPMVYFELVFGAGILLALYLVLKASGLWDKGISANYSSQISSAILVGLAAGVSTCMALVGGLVVGVSSKYAQLHPGAKISQKFIPHLYFNLGRIVLFFLLGGLLGITGSVLKLSTTGLGLLIVAVGAFMLSLGISLSGIFPKFNSATLSLPKSISRFIGIGDSDKPYSPSSSFILGGLTFFLPCGFTQAMQVYAIGTGSFWQGGAMMALFALGTVPGLLGLGWLTSLAKGEVGRYFFRFVAVLVIIMGLWNLSNGFNLLGLKPLGSQQAPTELSGVLEEGKRTVKIIQSERGYEPDNITVKKGEPVRLIFDSVNPYSCASSLVIPQLKVAKNLAEGENIIEFVPDKTGPMRFSCSMGMFTGVINVID